MNFLGLGGADGTASANQGVQNYMNSAGYDTLLKTGSKAITGSNAAKGLFQSGATGKALTDYGAKIGEQGAQNYLGNLQGLAQLGIGSAGVIGGAGQKATSTGSGNSNNGIIPGLFSDERLKKNIRFVAAMPVDGLGIYTYEYIFLPGVTFMGVIAQEVARKRPWALGRKVLGFMTVRYDKLDLTAEGK
jgi:hypothetical protein